MKKMTMTLLLMVAVHFYACAQELFVYTEPASNIAKGGLGFRITNSLMQRRRTGRLQYNLLPEATVGINKKLMLRGEGILGNNRSRFVADGVSLYAKYRFLSNDDVQKHFRMAAFGRASYVTSPIRQQEIETAMYNSGYEGGLVATQLLHKVAISASISYERALNNGSRHPFQYRENAHAVNYTMSAGKLILPAQYKSFNQTNLNGMVELLGQYNTGLQHSFLDIAPAIQLIFNSRFRVDAGYRHQLYSNLRRMAKNSFLLRFEYNLFNVF